MGACLVLGVSRAHSVCRVLVPWLVASVKRLMRCEVVSWLTFPGSGRGGSVGWSFRPTKIAPRVGRSEQTESELQKIVREGVRVGRSGRYKPTYNFTTPKRKLRRVRRKRTQCTHTHLLRTYYAHTKHLLLTYHALSMHTPCTCTMHTPCTYHAHTMWFDHRRAPTTRLDSAPAMAAPLRGATTGQRGAAVALYAI